MSFEFRTGNFVRIVLAAILVYCSIAAPAAEANLWSERRRAVQAMTPAPALEIAVNKPMLPVETARVIETRMADPGSPMLYHFQDMHEDGSAQKNLHRALTVLFQNSSRESTDLILSEGSSGDLDIQALASFPDSEIKSQVLRELFDSGALRGDEFYALTTPRKVLIRGIEDPELYKENGKAQGRVRRDQKAVLEYLKNLEPILNNIKESCFSQELKNLDKLRRLLSDGEISPEDYLQKAAQSVQEKHRSAWNNALAGRPQCRKILDTLSRFPKSDFSAVPSQSQALLKRLGDKLSKEDLSQLFRMNLEVRLGRTEASPYYSILLSQGRRFGLPTGNLENYVEYLKLFDTVKMDALAGELDSLSLAILERIADSDRQSKALRITVWREMNERLWSLKAAPGDWSRYLSLGRMKPWKDFAADFPELKTVLPPDVFVAHRRFAEKYFESAEKRNKALAENAVAAIKSTGAKKAALVMGGFHTQETLKEIAKENISYTILQPSGSAEDQTFRAASPLANPAKVQDMGLMMMAMAATGSIGKERNELIRQWFREQSEKRGWSSDILLSDDSFSAGHHSYVLFGRKDKRGRVTPHMLTLDKARGASFRIVRTAEEIRQILASLPRPDAASIERLANAAKSAGWNSSWELYIRTLKTQNPEPAMAQSPSSWKRWISAPARMPLLLSFDGLLTLLALSKFSFAPIQMAAYIHGAAIFFYFVTAALILYSLTQQKSGKILKRLIISSALISTLLTPIAPLLNLNESPGLPPVNKNSAVVQTLTAPELPSPLIAQPLVSRSINIQNKNTTKSFIATPKKQIEDIAPAETPKMETSAEETPLVETHLEAALDPAQNAAKAAPDNSPWLNPDQSNLSVPQIKSVTPPQNKAVEAVGDAAVAVIAGGPSTNFYTNAQYARIMLDLQEAMALDPSNKELKAKYDELNGLDRNPGKQYGNDLLAQKSAEDALLKSMRAAKKAVNASKMTSLNRQTFNVNSNALMSQQQGTAMGTFNGTVYSMTVNNTTDRVTGTSNASVRGDAIRSYSFGGNSALTHTSFGVGMSPLAEYPLRSGAPDVADDPLRFTFSQSVRLLSAHDAVSGGAQIFTERGRTDDLQTNAQSADFSARLSKNVSFTADAVNILRSNDQQNFPTENRNRYAMVNAGLNRAFYWGTLSAVYMGEYEYKRTLSPGKISGAEVMVRGFGMKVAPKTAKVKGFQFGGSGTFIPTTQPAGNHLGGLIKPAFTVTAPPKFWSASVSVGPEHKIRQNAITENVMSYSVSAKGPKGFTFSFVDGNKTAKRSYRAVTVGGSHFGLSWKAGFGSDGLGRPAGFIYSINFSDGLVKLFHNRSDLNPYLAAQSAVGFPVLPFTLQQFGSDPSVRLGFNFGTTPGLGADVRVYPVAFKSGKSAEQKKLEKEIKQARNADKDKKNETKGAQDNALEISNADIPRLIRESLDNSVYFKALRVQELKFRQIVKDQGVKGSLRVRFGVPFVIPLPSWTSRSRDYRHWEAEQASLQAERTALLSQKERARYAEWFVQNLTRLAAIDDNLSAQNHKEREEILSKINHMIRRPSSSPLKFADGKNAAEILADAKKDLDDEFTFSRDAEIKLAEIEVRLADNEITRAERGMKMKTYDINTVVRDGAVKVGRFLAGNLKKPEINADKKAQQEINDLKAKKQVLEERLTSLQNSSKTDVENLQGAAFPPLMLIFSLFMRLRFFLTGKRIRKKDYPNLAAVVASMPGDLRGRVPSFGIVAPSMSKPLAWLEKDVHGNVFSLQIQAGLAAALPDSQWAQDYLQSVANDKPSKIVSAEKALMGAFSTMAWGDASEIAPWNPGTLNNKMTRVILIDRRSLFEEISYKEGLVSFKTRPGISSALRQIHAILDDAASQGREKQIRFALISHEPLIDFEGLEAGNTEREILAQVMNECLRQADIPQGLVSENFIWDFHRLQQENSLVETPEGTKIGLKPLTQSVLKVLEKGERRDTSDLAFSLITPDSGIFVGEISNLFKIILGVHAGDGGVISDPFAVSVALSPEATREMSEFMNSVYGSEKAGKMMRDMEGPNGTLVLPARTVPLQDSKERLKHQILVETNA